MNIEEYRERRRQLSEQGPKFRQLCTTCLQSEFSCYCQHIRKFNPGITFVILIHPLESKRRIATGRMAHLCLEGSLLLRGQNFSENKQVNQILNHPEFESIMLYPGPTSIDLSRMPVDGRANLFTKRKKLAIFVIDGTWATARKMVRESRNLAALPRICFTPSRPSNFRVRKQPAAGCFSTIEAIHETIELLKPARDTVTANREHDSLLYVFDQMVEHQLECIRTFNASRHARMYRRVGK